MNRRKYLIGAGALVVGGAAAVGTAASEQSRTDHTECETAEEEKRVETEGE